MSSVAAIQSAAAADAPPKKVRSIKRVVSAPVVNGTEEVTPKVRRIRRPTKDSASSAASPHSHAGFPVAAAPVQQLPSIPETFVETMDDPLTVREVVRVTLRKFTHGRTT